MWVFFFLIHMASTIKIKDFPNVFIKKLLINHDSMILIFVKKIRRIVIVIRENV